MALWELWRAIRGAPSAQVSFGEVQVVLGEKDKQLRKPSPKPKIDVQELGSLSLIAAELIKMHVCAIFEMLSLFGLGPEMCGGGREGLDLCIGRPKGATGGALGKLIRSKGTLLVGSCVPKSSARLIV